MPSLSVIIPTHKRADTLEHCLHCLEAQTIVDDIEVVVISDGPDEATEKLCTEKEWNVTVIYDAIEKKQQGSARNRGLTLANSKICMFIGDDIFLHPKACERHVKSHDRVYMLDTNKRSAVLGFTTWDPSLNISTVMKWLEKSGWQFGYPKLRKYIRQFIPKTIQHRFTYTSHISLPTRIAREHLFREDLSMYGWEDIEWGIRLQQSGVRLYYEPSAKAWHHHHISLSDSLKRMETLGRSVLFIAKLAPEMRDRIPTGLKYVYFVASSYLPTMAGVHRRAFLRGLRKGKRELDLPPEPLPQV